MNLYFCNNKEGSNGSTECQIYSFIKKYASLCLTHKSWNVRKLFLLFSSSKNISSLRYCYTILAKTVQLLQFCYNRERKNVLCFVISKTRSKNGKVLSQLNLLIRGKNSYCNRLLSRLQFNFANGFGHSFCLDFRLFL